VRRWSILALAACRADIAPPPPPPPAPPPVAPPPDTDKIEPPLREQYLAWRDHPIDPAEAARIVDRWTCHDARYDETRGVSRCEDMPHSTAAEYEELEAARLVLDPHAYVEVWADSELSARALAMTGVRLFSSRNVPEVHQAFDVSPSRHVDRTVYVIYIMPIDLHDLGRLIANPVVLSVRRRELASIDMDYVEPLPDQN
jgi:hypothetical protein